eukprot:1599829-Rhodomonas_salina.2
MSNEWKGRKEGKEGNEGGVRTDRVYRFTTRRGSTDRGYGTATCAVCSTDPDYGATARAVCSTDPDYDTSMYYHVGSTDEGYGATACADMVLSGATVLTGAMVIPGHADRVGGVPHP